MARAGYQYGTSPKKLEPNYERKSKKRKLEIVEDIPRQKVQISSSQKTRQRQLTLIVIGIFVVLLTISYRNSQINEKFNQVQELKKELASLEKENEQSEVSIENSLNFNNIEKIAKEKLGMQKLTNKQTVYVTLPKKDYVEPATEDVIIRDETNWFQEFVNKIFNR